MKYGVLLGGQKEAHKEIARTFDNGGVQGIRVPDYNSNGSGYHFGLAEESNFFVTKMYYYHNSYADKNYGAYKTSLAEKGFVTTLGLKLWILQPFIGFKTYNTIFTINGDSMKDTYSILTYGLDLEIPVTRNAHLYAGYSLNKKKEITYEEAVKVNLEKSHSELRFGLRWNFGAVKATTTTDSPSEK